MSRLQDSETETRAAIDTLARLLFANATRLDLATLVDACDALDTLDSHSECEALEALEALIRRRAESPAGPAAPKARPLHCSCGLVVGHTGPCGGAK